MEYFVLALKKYAVFSGRSSRKEYWMFFLFSSIFGISLGVIDIILVLQINTPIYISSLFSLAILIPSIAVVVRRLHDIGKSGWLMLLAFVPFISIILLIFLIKKGDQNENDYGPSPSENNNSSAYNPNDIENTGNLAAVTNPNKQPIIQVNNETPVSDQTIPQVNPVMPTPTITIDPIETPVQTISPIAQYTKPTATSQETPPTSTT